MTPTNWGPGTPGLLDPESFTQFDPSLGTLTGVAITFSSTIRNNYELNFVQTPIMTTLYVATTATTDPAVLSNPTLVRQLTDGPTVSLLGPDGLTTIFGGPAATLPVDVVTLAEPSGQWSSFLPVGSPNYIAPSQATLSFTTTLDTSSSLLAQFIGTGRINLPVTADAHSSFFSSTGNGGGVVLTSADANVTIQYQYIPFPPLVTPEPSGLILLGLGTGLGLLAARRLRRSLPPAAGDRG